MKKILLIIVFLQCSITIQAQEKVYIDGRIRPVLERFFEYCKKYDIDYSEKLFQLESIKIVDTLPLSKFNTVLGKVLRDDDGNINKIVFNWATLFDKEILNVVAFHEFAHHFLDYKHTCHDCNEIMAETNPSYFDIARDWDNQVDYLFTTSPVYLKNQNDPSMASK
ncbi:MAG: hypothetical protein ACPG45_02320 [Flavobacteriaceae bacterium]